MAGETTSFMGVRWIQLVELFIILMLFWVPASQAVDILDQQRKVEGSATNLTSAINAVYDCAVNHKPEKCDTTAFATINMDDAGTDPGSIGDDPRWIIYYKYNPEKTNQCSVLTAFEQVVTLGSVDSCSGSLDPNWKGVTVVWAENDVGGTPDYCGPPDSKGTCYGSAERKGYNVKPLSAVLEKNDGNVRPFWFISPCYARVKAYWDGNQVKLQFVEGLRPEGQEQNFCCDANSPPDRDLLEKIVDGVKNTVNSAWPENGAFEGSNPPSNKPANDGKYCDFTQ
ncbi:MAG: hypothetical protein HY366_00895 [Candidatus Aenigmarchaeota archaeon]|nr:hypothetical protein [Candidatus Aenigmarchaeota archaeon]